MSEQFYPNQNFADVSARVSAFHLPRYERLPEIELYMDQLISYINHVLGPLASNEELVLTKSMVNNYVKQKVITAPVKKRYGREQLASLLMLCLLKQVFSIPECVQLMELAACKGGDPVRSYNSFCTELESALRRSFGGAVSTGDTASALLRMTQAVADKIYLQKLLSCEEARRRGAARKAAR